MAKLTDELKDSFATLVSKNHFDQAKFVLNAFWNDGLSDEAEQVYEYASKFVELDDAGEDGNELDEFESHRFLELTDGAITVLALRNKLRDIDLDFNGKMALTEFLVFRYDLDVTTLLTRPQNNNGEALAEAEAKLKKVQAAFQAASSARDAAVEAEEFSTQKANESKAAADVAQAAEAEVQQAVDALKAEEDAYNGKIETLTAKSTDSNIGIVSRNRAAAELAQLKSEDPLPLRRAKITQESALKRQQKVTKIATAAAAAAAEAAEEAKQAAAVAAKAVADAEEELKQAEAYLQEVKSMPGNAEGTIWILEKQMHEAAKYMPAGKAARFLAQKQAEIAAQKSA
ncbi:MAG: hypothetical protein MHM6MM_007223 [Cercozoa sp. M6MM]